MRIGSLFTVLGISFTLFYFAVAWLFGQQYDPLLFVDDQVMDEWVSRYPTIESLHAESMRDNFLSVQEIESMRQEYLSIKQQPNNLMVAK